LQEYEDLRVAGAWVFRSTETWGWRGRQGKTMEALVWRVFQELGFTLAMQKISGRQGSCEVRLVFSKR
jgi:hypothetical protein